MIQIDWAVENLQGFIEKKAVCSHEENIILCKRTNPSSELEPYPIYWMGFWVKVV